METEAGTALISKMAKILSPFACSNDCDADFRSSNETFKYSIKK